MSEPTYYKTPMERQWDLRAEVERERDKLREENERLRAALKESIEEMERAWDDGYGGPACDPAVIRRAREALTTPSHRTRH